MFCKKGVLRNFTNLTGKLLCESLLFNKVTGLSPVTVLKKRLWHECFPVNFAKFLRTSFFTELGRLEEKGAVHEKKIIFKPEQIRMLKTLNVAQSDHITICMFIKILNHIYDHNYLLFINQRISINWGTKLIYVDTNKGAQGFDIALTYLPLRLEREETLKYRCVCRSPYGKV